MKRASMVFGLLCGAVPLLMAQAPAKRRIAVLDFDYATVHQYVYDAFGSDVDIGKGIADMLVTNLVKNGTYSVIERKQLDKVLQEQNFQQSGRADPSSAVQLAKILGVDAIIIGSITQFGRDDKKLGVSGAGVHVGGIGIGGFGKHDAKAVVAIDARIVSTTTAEILDVATGFGKSERSSTSLAGGVAVGGSGAAGAVDMGSSNFANTIIGEATRKAVDSMTPALVAASPKIQETKVEIKALVADVSGSELIINAGSSSGVRVGAEYDVLRPGRDVKDPVTGKVLKHTTTTVGKIKITQVDDESSTGTLTGGPAKVGDCVGACPAQIAPDAGGGGAVGAAAGGAALQAAPSSGGGGGGGALPSLYSAPITGAFTWGMYAFKGTEHFKYNVTTKDGGETKNGFYTIDAQPAGSGRYRLTINGKVGEDAYGSSVTLSPNEGVPMMQLASLGPAGIALFNPMWGYMFMGHEWEVGNYWTMTQSGKTMSFKVEATCSYAGVNGLRGVWREDQKVLVDMCVSPNVGLPLASTYNDDSGSNQTTTQLAEFRP